MKLTVTKNQAPMYEYIRKICRIRNLLLKRNKSHKNCLLMLRLLNSVQTNLEAYPNRSPLQLAKFFLNHSTEIFEMIPSAQCRSHQKLINDYQFYYRLSKEILQTC